jgi:DNA helicase HerA-like ATPase
VRGVAISGKAGSGKSTFADLLVSSLAERGICAKRFAFGTRLKQETEAAYGVRKGDPAGRACLVYHGERRRATDPLYWIRLLARDIDAEGSYVFPVIDDLRFTTELAWAMGAGFFVVRLEADRETRLARLLAAGHDGSIVDHTEPTETGLDRSGEDFDAVYENGDGAPLAAYADALAEYAAS